MLVATGDNGVDRMTIPLVSPAMNIYPADEQRISDVERGRICEAVVPAPAAGSLSAGDTVLFALSHSRAGQPPSYVNGGDSVLVSLINVAALGESDPSTGQALFHLRWEPLGQTQPADTSAKRGAKSRRSPGRA
jgi:hypothetical protein